MTVRRHQCARCGKRQPVERMVYSRHTGNRYCAAIDVCGRRAKRINRERNEAPAHLAAGTGASSTTGGYT